MFVMSWFAADAIDETVDETKDFLTPIETGLWARIAVVVFFVGSISLNTSIPPLPPETFMSLSQANFAVSAALIAGLVVVSAVIGLGLLFLSSVFNLVLFQGLMEKEFNLRSLFSQNIGRGLCYMGFQLAALFVGLIFIAGAVLTVMLESFFIIPIVILLIPLAVISGIVMTLVHDFVLPEMIKSNSGLITSMKTVYGDIRDQVGQVAIYLILKFVLTLAAGIAVSFGSVIIILMLAILLGVPAALLSMIGLQVGLVFIVIGAVLFVALITFLVSVPVNVFFYLYALNVFEKMKM